MTERRLNHRSEVRAAIWDACGGRCHHCDKELHPFRDFHIDHLIALALGGADSIENLAGSCGDCNRRKNARATFDPHAPRVVKARRSSKNCQTKAQKRTQPRRVVSNDSRKEIDGAKVRKLRMSCVIGQRELAKAAGVSRETVAKVEAGNRVRSYPETIRKLADALGVAPADLLKDVRRE